MLVADGQYANMYKIDLKTGKADFMNWYRFVDSLEEPGKTNITC